jgi:hypothetical protein
VNETFRSYYYYYYLSFAVGKSAVKMFRDVLVGRPYGGIAILFRKELAACIIAVETNDPRLCVIECDSNIAPI